MLITITNATHITGIPRDLKDQIKAKLTISNPKWHENQRMGRWQGDTPRELRCYEDAAAGGLIVEERVKQHSGEKKRPAPVIPPKGVNKPTPQPPPPQEQGFLPPEEPEVFPPEESDQGGIDIPAHVVNQPHVTALVKAINADRKKQAHAVENLAKKVDAVVNSIGEFAPLYRDYMANGTKEERIFAKSIYQAGAIIMQAYMIMGYDLRKVHNFYNDPNKEKGLIE